MEFNQSSVRAFSDEAIQAIRDLEAKHGVTVRLGGGKIEGASFSLNLVVASSDSAQIEMAERSKFTTLCRSYDMMPEDYGLIFKGSKSSYRVVGFTPTRRKFPVDVVEVGSGKLFKHGRLHPSTIHAARMEAEAKAASEAKAAAVEKANDAFADMAMF